MSYCPRCGVVVHADVWGPYCPFCARCEAPNEHMSPNGIYSKLCDLTPAEEAIVRLGVNVTVEDLVTLGVIP